MSYNLKYVENGYIYITLNELQLRLCWNWILVQKPYTILASVQL